MINVKQPVSFLRPKLIYPWKIHFFLLTDLKKENKTNKQQPKKSKTKARDPRIPAQNFPVFL